MRCQAYEENSFSGAKDTKMELHRKSGLKFPGEKRTGPQSEEESSHRTFDIGAPEDQLLDLRGPRHGRQHLEGILAVDPAAKPEAYLAELWQPLFPMRAKHS